MFSLPDIVEKYPVGATTFAARIPPPSNQSRGHIIGNAKYKASARNGGLPHAPALVLEEVAFTAYYPADIPSENAPGSRLSKGMHWLTRPVHSSLRGYAYFAGTPFWLVYLLFRGISSLLKIPAYPNAPLLHPQRRDEGGDKPWPLVIFSHGLGGTRTNYSHVCSRLAAEGKIVLAIEHRDGTSPFVMTRTPIPGRNESTEQPGPSDKIYINPDDVYWENEIESDKLPLRRDQLAYRRLETYLTYTYFRRLVETTIGDEDKVDTLHTIDGPWNFEFKKRSDDLRFWKSWTRDAQSSDVKVDISNELDLVGHSFGSATVLSILSEPIPSLEGHSFSSLPVKHVVALDPWIEPLPSPGPSPRQVETSLAKSPSPPKLLVMNSEGFTFWDDHFARLRETVETWNDAFPVAAEDNARLLTLLRGKHIAFSDFWLLIPFGQQARDARIFADLILDLSVAFLDGNFSEVLQKQNIKDHEIEPLPKKQGWEDKRYVGGFGDLVIHI